LQVRPAIQVGLGDLFIQAVQTRESVVGAGKTLLVETHSEHIMLRLLRRIRETSENEVPPGAIGPSPDGLSVMTSPIAQLSSARPNDQRSALAGRRSGRSCALSGLPNGLSMTFFDHRIGSNVKPCDGISPAP
jgi:hypothetical protein